MGEYSGSTEQTAVGVRVAIVASRFNEEIVKELVRSASEVYRERGGVDEYLTVTWVPGAFEIPLAAQTMASTGRYDAIVTLGAVIRGATSHFEYVAGPTASSIAAIQLATGIPVSFGVLTVESIEQAIERAGTKAGNKGEEAAVGAIEMARLVAALRDGSASA